MTAFVDTDVLVRLLTGDDPEKAARARRLFDRAGRGELKLAISVTGVADAVYVLSSPRLFGLRRTVVADMLRGLLTSPGIDLEQSERTLQALSLYAALNIDFGDAFVALMALADGDATVYSFDRDYDRVPGLRRLEP